eukprot:gene826-808_t
MTALFEALHLRKRYGETTVVDDVSFAIAPGELHFTPQPGTAPLLMPRDALAIKAQLGVVTQFDTLDPDFTCAENLRVFGRYFGLKGAVMDERRLQLLLQQGKSILLTTHFMDEAERLCSRLLVLDHGRKIAEGRPRELIAQHLEPDVVEVFGVGAVQMAEDAALRTLAARVEISGETVFFYTQNAQPLLQALGQHGHLRTLHRPANLEDLFLKLTGRQIRE